METENSQGEMDWIHSLWKFDNCLVVNSVGRKGGLALLWSSEVQLEVISFSKNHIDSIIKGFNDKGS